MGLKEAEAEIVRDFDELGDEMLIMEYMLQMAAEMDWMPEERRTSENRVKGCQSGAWMEACCEEGKMKVSLASESLIVQGILAVLLRIIQGQPCEEVADYGFDMLEETFISDYLSEERTLGIRGILEQIRWIAAQA